MAEELLDLNELAEEMEETPKPRRKKRPRKSTSTASVKEVPKDTKPKRPIKDVAIEASKKIQAIKDDMKSIVFEREEVIDDLFRAIVASEHLLMLGPPGTGKSYLADLLKRYITDAKKFSWLMNRTTDPSDIVGPYSVSAMENDRFLRVTTGKLPEADIAFLDEIFKANEPSLNYMLSMLNEGVIYNDGKAVPVNLKIVLGASNEYPESEDLDAFYDRFVFRHWVNYIQDPQKRIDMAEASRITKQNLLPPVTLSIDEISALQEYVYQIQFNKNVAKTYDKMIRALQTKDIFISDRRYVKGQQIMMANALLQGRDQVTTEDFRALTFMLWNKDVKEIEIIADELSKFVNPYESKIKDLYNKAKSATDKVMGMDNPTERAGEAVQINVTLDDILGKIEDEIDEAKKQGMDFKPLVKYYDMVDEMMKTIASECLKQSVRGQRKW